MDSAHIHTWYGNVLESHEISGRAYNNISGPVGVGPGVTGVIPLGRAPTDGSDQLPPRP